MRCGTPTGDRNSSAREEEPVTTQPSGPGGREPQRPTQSSQPPAERPTGPPSGPLSGGRQGPPPPAPPAPPGGTPPGPPGPPAKGPWWRSGPRLATALVAVAAAVVLAVVLTRPSGSPAARGEVFLQPASATGPAPFTESTAVNEATPPPESPPPPRSATPAATTGTRSVSGSAPGLYGGTRETASCHVEQQIRLLSAEPAKNAAFASALGIRPSAVPVYLRSLTPVQLRMDTRVTNHGYRDGKATAYQAVLQAGTAVMIDDRGVPRVRCACGNPLGPPVPLKAGPKRHGQPWSSYQPAKVVVIEPATTVVDKFVIYDQHDRRWFERDRGDHHGKHDKPVPPPVVPSVPVTPTPPAPETSPARPARPTESHLPSGPPATTRSAQPSAPATAPPSAQPSAPPSAPPSQPPSRAAAPSAHGLASPSGITPVPATAPPPTAAADADTGAEAGTGNGTR